MKRGGMKGDERMLFSISYTEQLKLMELIFTKNNNNNELIN
jgi:hypothetical protein